MKLSKPRHVSIRHRCPYFYPFVTAWSDKTQQMDGHYAHIKIIKSSTFYNKLNNYHLDKTKDVYNTKDSDQIFKYKLDHDTTY